MLRPRHGRGSRQSGTATLLALVDRRPAVSRTLFDLGEALPDGRREISPPLVRAPDGIHAGVRADASQEQDH